MPFEKITLQRISRYKPFIEKPTPIIEPPPEPPPFEPQTVNYRGINITNTAPNVWEFTLGVINYSAYSLSNATSQIDELLNITRPLPPFPSQGILHGAFLLRDDIYGSDLEARKTDNLITSLMEFNSLTGKQITILTAYGQHFPNSMDYVLTNGSDYSLLPLLKAGLITGIVLDWIPFITVTDGLTCFDIAFSNKYDNYIKEQALLCKDVNFPIFIRFGAEINLTNVTPIDYITAYRKVVNIFNENEVTNVWWVFCPSWGGSPLKPWSTYYPGDPFIDIIGFDMYQNREIGFWVDPRVQLDSIYDYYPNKPFIIGEWGTNAEIWQGSKTDDAQRADYTEKFFNTVKRPNMKMISYFYSKTHLFTEETEPLTTETYRRRIAESDFV